MKTPFYTVEIEELDEKGNVFDSHTVFETDDYDLALQKAEEQELTDPSEQVSIWEWNGESGVNDSWIIKTYTKGFSRDTLATLIRECRGNCVCAYDFLATRAVPEGLTMEQAFLLYIAVMKTVEKDKFIRVLREDGKHEYVFATGDEKDQIITETTIEE